MEGAPVDKEERFAEWYVWAKREIGNESRVCLGAAQAAVETLETGGDEQAAQQAARRSVIGQGIALLERIPARQRAYAEWYDWARREIGGDRDRLHRAAHAALNRLDQAGDATQAAAAAREAVGAGSAPPPFSPGAYVSTPSGMPAPPIVAPAPAEPAPAQPASAQPAPAQPAPAQPAYPSFPAYPAYPQAAQPVPPPAPGHAYAGFWRRAAAYLIDSVLIAICLVVLSFVGTLFAIIGLASSGQDITTDNLSAVQLVLYLIAFVLAWLYYAGLESSPWQGTVGKRLLRLVVTDRYGRRIGFGRATGRYFGKVGTALVFLIGALLIAFVLGVFFGDLITGPLSWLIGVDLLLALLAWLVFGYLMIALTRRRQGLHDLMAGTLVVRQEHLALIAAPPREAAPPAAPQGTSEVQGA